MSRRPNFFIIGAPKSGTTSLYAYLDGHPEVFMSSVKEPFYFSPDVQGVTRKRLAYPDGESEYLDLFAHAGDAKRVGEASTRYIFSTVAPELIHNFQPDARIVASLRNPVDMIHSLHNERVSFGMETIVDFDEALAADPERLNGRLLRKDETPEYAAYRPNVRYAEQLARWFAKFDRSRIHVMIFEDFAADTATEFHRLLEFLDVDPDYTPKTFAARRKSHRRRGGVVHALTSSRPVRWTTRRLLPSVVGQNKASSVIWRFRQSPLLREENVREEIRPELRRQLEDEFMPDVSRLSEMLGRDLGELWFKRPALSGPAA